MMMMTTTTTTTTTSFPHSFAKTRAKTSPSFTFPQDLLQFVQLDPAEAKDQQADNCWYLVGALRCGDPQWVQGTGIQDSSDSSANDRK